MYKSRLWLWILIGIVFVAFVNLKPYIKSEIIPAVKEEYEKSKNEVKPPKTATVYSSNAQLRQNLNEKKIEGTKLVVEGKNADIIISEGVVKTDGYIQDEYYSPIVALMDNSMVGAMFKDISKTNRVVRNLNLQELMYGFLNDLKFSEFYTYSSSSSITKYIPELYVDTRYEKEIKTAMVMALTGKCEITQKDIDENMEYVNAVWDKANKPADIDTMLISGLDKEIVLTIEGKMLNNGSLQPLTLTNTVCVRYTVEHKEGVNLEQVMDSDTFIKGLALRKIGHDQIVKDIFCNSDWTISYLFNDELNFEYDIATLPAQETGSVEDNADNAEVIDVAVNEIDSTKQFESTEENQQELQSQVPFFNKEPKEVIEEAQDLTSHIDESTEQVDDESDMSIEEALDNINIEEKDDKSLGEVVVGILCASMAISLICGLVLAALRMG